MFCFYWYPVAGLWQLFRYIRFTHASTSISTLASQLCSRRFFFQKGKNNKEAPPTRLESRLTHNANSHDNNNKEDDSCAASSWKLEYLDDNPLHRYLPIGECLSTRNYWTWSFEMNSIQLDGFDHNLIDNWSLKCRSYFTFWLNFILAWGAT